jgi:hypothetical protein
MSDGDGEMTLAFSLAAVKRLAKPQAAFEDAARWSRNLGIVSQNPRAVMRYVRDDDLRQDFFTGNRPTSESLALIIQQFETDRYVFVGATGDEQRIGDAADWEYLPITEAAEQAGWTLADDESRQNGLLSRFIQWIGDGGPFG